MYSASSFIGYYCRRHFLGFGDIRGYLSTNSPQLLKMRVDNGHWWLDIILYIEGSRLERPSMRKWNHASRGKRILDLLFEDTVT